MEYGGVIFGNLTEAQSNELEKLQCECARIITGLPRFCSREKLYSEAGIEPLSDRRRKQRLVLLFKILHGYTPGYLYDLLPTFRTNPSVRNDRHFFTFHTELNRNDLHYKSFFPRSTREWNDLDVSIRTCQTLSNFKNLIGLKPEPVPSLSESDRRTSIIFTQLKHECSPLSAHLNRVNITETAMCRCRLGVESNFHFLYDCPYYDVPRQLLMYEIDRMGLHDLSMNTLLHCDSQYDEHMCTKIQNAVYRYIRATGRFNSNW